MLFCLLFVFVAFRHGRSELDAGDTQAMLYKDYTHQIETLSQLQGNRFQKDGAYEAQRIEARTLERRNS